MGLITLVAGRGLSVDVDSDGVRIGSGTADWFGPGRLTANGEPRALDIGALVDGADELGTYTSVTVTREQVEASLRAYHEEPVVVFRLAAREALDGLATGEFARTSLAWPHFQPTERHPGGVPDSARGFGFQFTEFAWPTQADADLSTWRLLPFRPAVVEPLGIAAPGAGAIVIAPIDGFHEQVISVADGVACGWHGDLERVPAGFATETAVVAGDGARACLDLLGAIVRRRGHTAVRATDELGRRLSYWTDNGAAYWYRTEAGHDVAGTLQATLDDLHARRIPVGPVQLDSWWYPHEVLRPFDTDEWIVPPTGLARWEPRDDALPRGMPALRRTLDDAPLVTHCRHLSSSSPYVDEYECWVDGDRAHPTTIELYERWLDQASSWGVVTFEHDWLIESYLGVRGLRAEPGRARAWQEGLDRAASARGLTLQWCMASPADFLQAASLRSVTSIRTSGDHGYLLGPGELWAWFLLTNAVARALGLRPFKDVFHSDPGRPGNNADVEALLSALSTGPVGIGDALGRADRDVVMCTCRNDGTLVQPDVPIAAVDDTYLTHPVARPVPLVAEAWTDHPAGRWVYVVTLNVTRTEQPVAGELRLADLGRAAPAGPVACWEWRAGTAMRLAPEGSWPIALDFLDWDYRVLAPIGRSGIAVIGDPSRYATAGRARVASVRDDGSGVRFTVLGAGETVRVVGWASPPPAAAMMWTPAGGRRPLELAVDGETWWVAVPVPDTGWANVEVQGGVQ